MTQPVWITDSGSLGTVPEGVYYGVTVATEANDQTVFYRVIAGSLPTNTYCDTGGEITGIPSTEVTAGQDVVVTGAQYTSMFTIRAYTTINDQATGRVDRFCDRTFTITVVSKNTPAWITPAGSIGSFYDGTLLEPGYQFLYTDNPLPGVTPITLVSGQLPPGITISGTGLMSGYFTPNPAISTLAGYSRDGQPYSPDPPTVYKFDFNTQSESYTYQFTLQVTDGVQRVFRTFTMSIWNPALFTADAVTISYVGNPPVLNTDPMSADNAQLPASISSIIPPVIINPQGNIGTYRNDNFFAYRFIAYDYSNNPVIFEGFRLPPGLTLDATTGWLYGYIPDLGITEETYTFDIRVMEPFDISPYTVSELYTYSVTFVGAINTQITWLSPADLGTVDNGSTSTFSIRAVDTLGLTLQYRIKSGSNSRLPQGLTLLPSGNIVGRVSFIIFALDNNTTTFDSGTTTFDLTYTFTVNAYSANGVISVFKEFTIHIRDAYPLPYNNLYISCMPPRDDRTLIQSLLQNTDIFPPALLYRPDDPNFGVATSVVYNHAYGLTAATLSSYVTALELNHYWKNLVLGEIKTAQALDDAGNIIYEVVYSEVIDDQVNSAGESVSKIVPVPYPVNVNTPFQIDDVYPNSLVNMRDQVIDTVGQVSNILPRWMYSKQKDGRVLGFTPAWVIAYTNPNASGQVAYNISQQFGNNRLNLIDFKADRYELDRSMTVNWDPVTQSWIPSPAEQVTFDVKNHYELATIEIDPPVGAGYAIGDRLVADGTYFGGTSPANDVEFKVCQVSNTGAVEQVFVSGAAPYNVNTPNLVLSIDNVLTDAEANPPNTVITFDTQTAPPFLSGSTILIAHATPASYNGTYTVVASGVNRISIAGVNTEPYVGGGTICNVTEWPAVPAVLLGEAPAATSTSTYIAPVNPAKTVYGTIAGTKLTATGGAPAVGQLLFGTGVADGTYIVAPIFGVLTTGTSYTYTAGTGTLAGRVTYSNVSQLSTSGSGTGAVWNIRKNNTTTSYSTLIYTLVAGGENYAIGDTVTISGADLGGTSPANDLTFTLGGTVSNTRCWTVNISQTVSAPMTMTARISGMTVSGTVTGTFATGDYITGGTILPGTQIIQQLTTTNAAAATTTATGTNNTRTITATAVTNIAVGQIVTGTGILQGTTVTAVNTTTRQVTLSQALAATASGTYTFTNPGKTGTYAVNILQAAGTTDIIATDVIFDVLIVPGQATVFDGGSVEFVDPADRTTNTNAADRYLLYPKDTVINNLPQSVTWLNDAEEPIEWVNSQSPPNPEAFWNT